MENKKYVLTDETVNVNGIILHRIQSISDFRDVKIGDLGGFIEFERNLSVIGEAWVYDSAKVYGEAVVCGDAKVYCEAQVYDSAQVYGKAKVSDSALVCDEAWVYDSAQVYDSAKVYGKAKVCGEACICDSAQVSCEADYIVFKNWWSSGRFFTWTKSNNMWKVGCFYGTGEKLIKKAYQDSELSGREYERVVQYVNSILSDENK